MSIYIWIFQGLLKQQAFSPCNSMYLTIPTLAIQNDSTQCDLQYGGSQNVVPGPPAAAALNV